MPECFGGSALNCEIGVPSVEHWKLQWHRVIRWYDRVNQIKIKSQKYEVDVYDIDIVIAFFQNCYHLRDWLQASRPDCKGQTDAFFTNNFEMAACRDICNGFKHKALTRPSLDADFSLYREYDHFAAEAYPSRNPIKYKVAFADGDHVRKYELFDLVERCFRLWDSFIFDEVDASAARVR